MHAVPRGTAWTTKIMEPHSGGAGQIENLDLLLDLSENMTGKNDLVLGFVRPRRCQCIKKFRSEFEAYLAGNRQP